MSAIDWFKRVILGTDDGEPGEPEGPEGPDNFGGEDDIE